MMDPNKQVPPPYEQYPGAGYPGYPPPGVGVGYIQPNVNTGFAPQGYPQGGQYNAGFAPYPTGPAPPVGFAPYPGGPPPAGFPYPDPGQATMGFRMAPDGPKPEDGNSPYNSNADGAFEFSDKTIRRGFIRKVYSILMVQMLVTVGFIALFVYHEGVKSWFRQNRWFYIVTLVMFVVMMLILTCCSSVRRRSPGNYICLGIFTVIAGAMLGAVSSTFNENTVLLAVGITTVVVFALTLFSFQTKIDFTRLNGFLFVAAIVLMVFGIVAIFLSHRFPILRIIYASLGALLFSVYLVHDTQLMIGGDHKYSISPEEYIFASLNIYLDVINIFLSVLSLVGSGNR